MTNLTVEGVKKLLDEKAVKYSSNLVAVIVSAVCTILLVAIYCTAQGIGLSAGLIAATVSLEWIAFLIATVGYDKVVQLIKQIGGLK